MTTKLYWKDSHLTAFTAHVEACLEKGGAQFVVLDQTAFYPTGGGQPCDVGRIGSGVVRNVEVGEDGRILHQVETPVEFAVGNEVACEVDPPHRREMIQQHTGQHILSQAFFQLFGAETRGFRITDRATEIDLTLELQPNEIEQAILRAEDLANSIVFDDRQIRIHEVTPEQAATLPLRKESFISDCVRVIEIADFDWSPCAGTHAQRTGEVGLIAIRGWERAKRMTRVHFVCGVRALKDYRLANKSAEAVALKFSVGRDDAEANVTRLIEDNKQLSRRVRELAEVAAKAEAADLFNAASANNGVRVIEKVFEGRDFEEVKLIAHRLVDHQDVVALLATREAGMVRLIFARSANLACDMNALMKAACERLGGRGGGKSDFAQGGGANVNELTAALESAKSKIRFQ
ncbi:MAG: DHHA1 domain-containing protein [Acidobacteriota bacterium]|nr:DHHA1 domain-containing protein [Acidobacteriota bacterium]